MLTVPYRTAGVYVTDFRSKLAKRTNWQLIKMFMIKLTKLIKL